MSVIRIPGCLTHLWLLYASLVVVRIPGCYTHPWLLHAPRLLDTSLTVIPIHVRYTLP